MSLTIGLGPTNSYSVTALYSMAAENDTEIEDELAKGA